MFPSCDGCPDGAKVARDLADAGLSWRGRGPGGRFDRGISGGERMWAAQMAARHRLACVGLLEPVPSEDERRTRNTTNRNGSNGTNQRVSQGDTVGE